MVNQELLAQFKDKLKEMFRSDNPSFNWGVYRIISQKNKDVEQFIEKDIPKIIEERLNLLNKKGSEELEKEIATLKVNLETAGVDPKTSPKYQELLKQKKELGKFGEFDSDIYNYLLDFFSRYFLGGDFISRFYFKNGTYVVPYDGSEIYMHWLTKDQYYVKTTDEYKRLSLPVGKVSVVLRVVAADQEKNNVKEKGKKVFVLASEPFEFSSESNELFVNLNHIVETEEMKKEKGTTNERQEKFNQAIIDTVKNESHVKGKIDEKELEKTVKKFQRRYTEDFFIHKNLKGFLENELQYYIQNEILRIDAVIRNDTEVNKDLVVKTQAFREIAANIIEKLATIEELKKKVWEKKKFVLETNYVITLDKIASYASEEFLENILDEIVKKKEQVAEWKELFDIDVKGKKDLIVDGDKSQKQLHKEWKKLPIDTKYFGEDFKFNLLVALSQKKDIDEILDGVLIKSENWQALNLLGNKYKNKIRCIHIDPPYNTTTSGFLYKNDFLHSSWLSMIQSRTQRAIELMSHEGLFLCHIDENEYENLHLLCERLSLPNAGTIVWDKRNPMNASKGVAIQHEYIICRTKEDVPLYLRNNNVVTMLEKAAFILKKYGNVNELAREEYADWVNSNKELSGGEKAYYYLDENGKPYQSVSLRAPEPRANSKFHKPLIHPRTKKPCPVPPNGFSRTPETLQEMINRGEILFGLDETIQPRQKVLLSKDSKRQLPSVIQEGRKGKADLFPLGLDFPYCHPVSLYEELLGVIDDNNGFVLDYFAGSGTTGHAVLNLNKKDDGKRKFILVEMGVQCDTILIPRIKKLLFSLTWKNGKPQSMDSIGGFFKYHLLEQYEDALENIEFKQTDLESFKLNRDLLFRYNLELGTENSKTFLGADIEKNFLNFNIITLDKNLQKVETPVDLIESFNYIIGLWVDKYLVLENKADKNRKYIVIKGKVKDEPVFVIWRDPKHLDPKKDKDFIVKEIIQGEKYSQLYVNSDCIVPNYLHIFDEWRKRLW